MNYKPLDVVKIKKNGSLGIIASVSLTQGMYQYAITFFENKEVKHAWWDGEELELINNIPAMIAHEMVNHDYEAEVYCDYVYAPTEDVITCRNCDYYIQNKNSCYNQNNLIAKGCSDFSLKKYKNEVKNDRK